jgi:hypothetical protein
MHQWKFHMSRMTIAVRLMGRTIVSETRMEVGSGRKLKRKDATLGKTGEQRRGKTKEQINQPARGRYGRSRKLCVDSGDAAGLPPAPPEARPRRGSATV